MACPCWRRRRLLSLVRCETDNTEPLSRRLSDAKEEAVSDGEALGGLIERVASLQRALESAVLQRNVAVALMHQAQRHAEEAEAAVEAAARAGELAAAEVREKMEQSVATDARIRELEREMLVLRDGEQWALETALEAAAAKTREKEGGGMGGACASGSSRRRCYVTSDGCQT
ncbi:hypothetical protein CFC21_040652 [Triticum aestivum]|uniref:Uncharacterized protein n=2 Tax=Triticum aestivum TaxID=4565 RepID=A0A3B6FMR0_WHEAT|nr:hypothetical protein CFC21_040652 [Triticum aestivum]